MKRQKGTPEVVAAEATKNKEKGAEEKTAEEVVVGEGIQPAEEVAELASLWSWVDEEMRWATSWIPFWEVEATGDAYDALYGDVLWDYDIWDLKSIRNTPPNP